MSEQALKRIWLFVTSDGRYKAHPSPCWLCPGQEFVIKNWTGDTVEVDFTGSPIGPLRVTIPGGQTQQFTAIDPAVPSYYEYTVITGRHKPVEGNSRPAISIDP